MPFEGLILRIRQEGAPETAKQLDDVARAQERISGQVRDEGQLATEAADGVGKLDKSQERARSSANAWAGVLNRINPMLGQIARMANRGTQALGGLAGGLIVAGLLAVAKALAIVRNETERLNQAFRDQSKALNEIEARRRGTAQSVEAVSDLRSEGGLRADESREATRIAQSIRERFGDALGENAISQAVGTLFGRGASAEQIERAAIAQQMGAISLDPSAPGQRTLQQLAVMEMRRGGAIDRFIEREQTQRREADAAAFMQLQAQGGRTLELQEFLARHGANDPTAMAEKLQDLSEKEDRVARDRARMPWAFRPADVRLPGEAPAGISSDAEWVEAQQHLRNLRRTGGVIINNYNQGSRHFASDGRTQADRRVNERSLIADMEER